ncbi:MAG TPA: ABC transporter ATP-binding protein, partial [Calidithermus sp.]|nr:ABC transporter ATP-binding protein [Calidithermus sp.]
MADPLLALADVHTYYGEAHILQGVSLAVPEGEVVTLIGRNGAGKTTTLRSVMGIVRPRRGRIRLRGQDITGLPPDQVARRGIAWVPEERRILPNLTVIENLRLGWLGAGARGDGRLEEVFAYFPRLRERAGHRGRHLSGGEQQMLAIARALVAAPAVMLVDEPTEGLAPLLVQQLTEILAAINRRGTTILLVEQS